MNQLPQPRTELIDSLRTVINYNVTSYRCVSISKIGNKFHFLRMEASSLEEAKQKIDELWNHINSKPFNL